LQGTALQRRRVCEPATVELVEPDLLLVFISTTLLFDSEGVLLHTGAAPIM